jgi:N-acetylglucosaminyldiphosphoundecaprenol N-acetyl-beta-D-mannosaminyltransferase
MRFKGIFAMRVHTMRSLYLPSHATAGEIRHLYIDNLPIAVLNIRDTAKLMIDAARRPHRSRPLYMTSANGEVIARCHDNPSLTRLFIQADVISADGQPMVTASRLFTHTPLPERVATTDLFHVVAKIAEQKGVSFYMLGATQEENERAVQRVQKLYPGLKIVGQSHGYLSAQEMAARVDEINALAPDILWVGLGVPHEQVFVNNFSSRLDKVGVIKTSGGLFNFLSRTRLRAPLWMQKRGMEWIWRLAQEPRRLFWRYAVTNPQALYILLTRMR